MNLTISQLKIIREALVEVLHDTNDENLKREILEITTIINAAQFHAEIDSLVNDGL